MICLVWFEHAIQFNTSISLHTFETMEEITTQMQLTRCPVHHKTSSDGTYGVPLPSTNERANPNPKTSEHVDENVHEHVEYDITT